MMPRDQIEEMLKQDGDFLLRKTRAEIWKMYALSVVWEQRVRHILLSKTKSDSKWFLVGSCQFAIL